ncbi:hypothetical protein EDC01DRAFT_313695 [Geopyxis carbonaria]|nr:hypothetical protein EDC01DRAFT_313695 [Geopyxis carbonaria]
MLAVLLVAIFGAPREDLCVCTYSYYEPRRCINIQVVTHRSASHPTAAIEYVIRPWREGGIVRQDGRVGYGARLRL